MTRPPGCSGCVADPLSTGFVLPSGPPHAPILFVGEAPWKDELRRGEPFSGMAGSMLERIFRRLGWDRSQFRFANVVQCAPPTMDFTKLPWAPSAIAHCRQYLDQVLAEPHRVVVPLGLTALRAVLDLAKVKGVSVDNFHGTVGRDPSDRFWVVPTYHPSHLQRGATNLIQTTCWDLLRAKEVADKDWAPDPGQIVVDPPLEWLRQGIDQYISTVRTDPWACPLAVDIETPDKLGKGEDVLGREDRSYQILRVNLSWHPDLGVTVPFEGAYLAEIARVLGAGGMIYGWNWMYDGPRLTAAAARLQLPGLDIPLDRVLDLMWAWHILQSDLPRGLGFAAPFYSNWGAWKHLASTQQATYAAIDGLQTRRVGDGILRDLEAQGMYDIFERHWRQVYEYALYPAQVVGVGIDRPALTAFQQELAAKSRETVQAIQACVPEALKPLTPKGGFKREPADGKIHPKAKDESLDEVKRELYAAATLVARTVAVTGYRCRACGAVDCAKTHRCAASNDQYPDRGHLEFSEYPTTRWFWQEPFNPDSWQQLLAYIKAKGHKPGRARDGKDTTDKETLKTLARQTGDPLYALELNVRAIHKVEGTYVRRTLLLLDDQDRVHPVPTNKPSTLRLSYVDPNITNVIADKGASAGSPAALAAGFRQCIVAADVPRLARMGFTEAERDRWTARWHPPSRELGPCSLWEVDYSGIEAKIVGWCARHPDYIRLAALGVHAGLASHILGTPYDPSWLRDRPDDLAAFFKTIKKTHPEVYDPAKRCVHGDNYGLTEYGMIESFPEMFPSLSVARRYKAIYRKMAPQVPQWQTRMRDLAYHNGYLGGPGDPREAWERGVHPFGYKHHFWSVIRYQPITEPQRQRILQKGEGYLTTEIQGKWYAMKLGEDAKRCVAFMPQSIAAGVLKETMLMLFDPASPSYIGDAWYGRTPLRAPIHDSLLLEVPDGIADQVMPVVYWVFQRPIPELPMPPEWGLGECLTIGIEAKRGVSWDRMETVDLPLAHAPIDEDLYSGVEDEDEDDVDDLRRSLA